MSTMKLAFAALAAVTLTGCPLIGGQPCDAIVADEAPAIGIRNPYSGQCEYWGGGGGGGTCGDYGGYDEPVPAEQVDWALCYSECTGLDEQACLGTFGCQAAYVNGCAEGAPCPDDAGYGYTGCWAVAPSGPVQGECYGLDAYECSRHDNCMARYFSGSGCGSGGDCAPGGIEPAVGNFESCAPEPGTGDGCYSDAECGPGSRCTAVEECMTPPGCDPANGCDTVCYGRCVPVDPPPPPPPPAGDCTSPVVCAAEAPACPDGTVAGRAGGCWTGYCIPVAVCEPPVEPGTCYGEVLCDSLAPACPDGTVPGVTGGCWSGYCIPASACEMPASCSEAPSEAACIIRDACAPIYRGVGCTCDPNGACVCEDWAYQECVDR